MKYRGFFTTQDHLDMMVSISNSTCWNRRLFQLYDIPEGVPYVRQLLSRIVAPCISVVSLELKNDRFLVKSCENQAEGMPSATPVNFATGIEFDLAPNDIESITSVPWKSPIFGWSKRNWLSLKLNSGESFLVGVHEMPKQANSKKTKKLLEALSGL